MFVCLCEATRSTFFYATMLDPQLPQKVFQNVISLETLSDYTERTKGRTKCRKAVRILKMLVHRKG